MGRLLIGLGIVLIFASVIFMGLVFGLAGEDVSAQIITPFACEDNETLRQEMGRIVTTSDGTGQTIDFFCDDSEGQERNVTGVAVMVIIIGFAGLLIAGIFSTIIGASIASKNLAQNFGGVISGQYGTVLNTQSATIDLRDGSFQEAQGQLTPELRNIMKQASNQLDNLSGGDTLADKLQQLEDAYEQRLISREEYDKTRLAILDKMDD
ncbi:MAG: hypothetical protein Phog2KO_33800 [Phototrophicaceae bacterium]